MQTHPSTLRLLSPQEPPPRSERSEREDAPSFERVLSEAQPETDKKPSPKKHLIDNTIDSNTLDSTTLDATELIPPPVILAVLPSPLLSTFSSSSKPIACSPLLMNPLQAPVLLNQTHPAPDLRIQLSRLSPKLSTEAIRLDPPQDLPPPTLPTAPLIQPKAPLTEQLIVHHLMEEQESTPEPVADPLLALPKLTSSQPLKESTSIYQATATDTLPELPVSLPTALHLEIQDEVGRWDLDVQRVGDRVHLEFQGDAQLRELIRESSREISQRFTRHGELLGAIHWRPLENTSSSHTGSESFQQQSSEKQQQHRQDSHNQDKHPQDAPPESFEQTLATT
jgi:hypothetical protein